MKKILIKIQKRIFAVFEYFSIFSLFPSTFAPYDVSNRENTDKVMNIVIMI